eukprot:TRINITY_DN43986_c0_g1_i1.p1 TRINITY_DN43986_c0_g1~~TRINITY_DN43986_c0_g1_i1.p1  ORF type:complete len:354 (+),score=109.27 TRINITY_DN43986_c0_g1_i1:63-1124(+)
MVEETLNIASEGILLADRLRLLLAQPRAGATARDAAAVAWLTDYLDSVIWQEDCIRVTKHADEILGVQWISPEHLVVQQVIEGSAADRHGLADYVGRRLTHVDAKEVHTVQQVRQHTKGKTEMRLRLAAAAAKGDRRSSCLGCAAARRFGADPSQGWSVGPKEWAALVREVSGLEATGGHYNTVRRMCGGNAIPCEMLVPALCEGCGMDAETVENVLARAIGFGVSADRSQARQQLGQALGRRYQPGSSSVGPEAFATLCADLGAPQPRDGTSSWRRACRAAGVDRRQGLPSASLVAALAQWPLECPLPESEASCCVLLLRALVHKLTAAATHPLPVHYPIFASRWGLDPSQG